MEKRLPRWLFLGLMLLNIFLATWYVRHSDIQFSSDIARDFLLLQELDQKKLILIGPRSSVGGLFHGPLWLYLTYPGYLLGNGNPVVMGWYWIILSVVFTWSCYFVTKRLFSQLAAQLATLMITLYMVYIVHGLFNPHGAMFLIPLFIYTAYQYARTENIRFAVIHMVLAGLIIQFQMAIGMPLLLLSTAYLGYWMVHRKNLIHVTSFLILLLPLSTYILFDLRHDHLLMHSAIRHLTSGNAGTSFLSLVWDRIWLLSTGIEFVRNGQASGNFIVFLLFSGFLVFQIKQNNNRMFYLTFIFYFLGFYALSLINRYPLLYFYEFPIFPLVFIIFSSLITTHYKKIFLFLFAGIYLFNLIGISTHIKLFEQKTGIGDESWKMYDEIASKLVSMPENEFGYFVYSPDTVGYQSNYATAYRVGISNKRITKNAKLAVTYLVVAPPPANNPNMKDQWWKENKLHLSRAADSVVTFASGYKIERYALTPEEILTSADPQIDPGIFFR